VAGAGWPVCRAQPGKCNTFFSSTLRNFGSVTYASQPEFIATQALSGIGPFLATQALMSSGVTCASGFAAAFARMSMIARGTTRLRTGSSATLLPSAEKCRSAQSYPHIFRKEVHCPCSSECQEIMG
jgi:hypothetical protein